MTVANTSALDAIGARAIPEFDGVHDVWPRGKEVGRGPRGRHGI